jgi:hypothetical protein
MCSKKVLEKGAQKNAQKSLTIYLPVDKLLVMESKNVLMKRVVTIVPQRPATGRHTH